MKGLSPRFRGLDCWTGMSLLIFALAFCGPLDAADDLDISGKLSLEGIYALDGVSRREDPSFIARVTMNWQKASWRLHSWIEAGWDGTVRSPQQDHAILKGFDSVYQDNTPYLEAKELYLEHSAESLDVRIGIQRFSWGRLDEYPVNDLLNPWDYTRFLVRPIEERKIGVPSISAVLSRELWTCQLVWVPWLVPYRLAKPNERWSLIPAGAAIFDGMPQEPDLPAKTFEHGSAGVRLQRVGEIEWALNFFHGYDPRPLFRTTALRVSESEGALRIDPGLVPAFNRITAVGLDAATVKGAWSLRGEAAYAFGRAFDTRPELWGYPAQPAPGATPLNPAIVERDTLDYGLAADVRLFEDALLTVQAQQTLIVDRPESLFDRALETLLWANIRVLRMNQKIELNLNFAYNPEHGASMLRPSAYYVFSDSWKVGVLGLFLDGPSQSLFGRFARNDQIGMVLTFSW